jgi:hypothetical protein
VPDLQRAAGGRGSADPDGRRVGKDLLFLVDLLRCHRVHGDAARPAVILERRELRIFSQLFPAGVGEDPLRAGPIL